MVLGIAHTPGSWNSGDDSRNTIDAIEHHRAGPPPGQRGYFFPAVARVLRAAVGYQAADIWDHVAFYNYFQDFVGPGKCPSADKWSAAEVPFRWVLNEFQPASLLVFGKVLRGHIEKTEPLVHELEVVWANHPRNTRGTVSNTIQALKAAIERANSVNQPRSARTRPPHRLGN